MWLVTDGRDTEGGALEAAAALAAKGLSVDVSAPSPPAADFGLLSARISSDCASRSTTSSTIQRSACLNRLVRYPKPQSARASTASASRSRS